MSRRDDILGIIRENPGATGMMIHDHLVRQSRAAKWFGEDSWLTLIFGPNSGSMYVTLWRLEEEGAVESWWGVPRFGNKYRLRHYQISTDFGGDVW